MIRIKNKRHEQKNLKDIKTAEFFLYGENVYMRTRTFDHSSISFNCVDLQTGEVKFIQESFPGPSVVPVDMEVELIYQ